MQWESVYWCSRNIEEVSSFEARLFTVQKGEDKSSFDFGIEIQK